MLIILRIDGFFDVFVGEGEHHILLLHHLDPASSYHKFFVLFLFLLLLFRAAPEAYGASQASQSYSCWPTPQPQQCKIQDASETYTTALGNTRPLNPLSEAKD